LNDYRFAYLLSGFLLLATVVSAARAGEEAKERPEQVRKVLESLRVVDESVLREASEPVGNLLARLQQGAHLKIDSSVSELAEVPADNPQRIGVRVRRSYAVRDEQLAKAIIRAIERDIQRGLEANPKLLVGKPSANTYVGVKVFADRRDKQPVTSVTLIGKSILFQIDETTYSVRTVSNDLFRKLLMAELTFDAPPKNP